MIEFLPPIKRRKISYADRIKQIRVMLNESPNRSLRVSELTYKWQTDPHYVRRLLRMAVMASRNLIFDEDEDILTFKEEVK